MISIENCCTMRGLSAGTTRNKKSHQTIIYGSNDTEPSERVAKTTAPCTNCPRALPATKNATKNGGVNWWQG